MMSSTDSSESEKETHKKPSLSNKKTKLQVRVPTPYPRDQSSGEETPTMLQVTPLPLLISPMSPSLLLGHGEECNKSKDVGDQQFPHSASQSRTVHIPTPYPHNPLSGDETPTMSADSLLTSPMSPSLLLGHGKECHTPMDVEEQQLPQSASQSRAEVAFVSDTSRPEPSDPHDVSPPLSSLSRKSPVSSFCSSVLDAILSSSSSLSGHEEEYPTSKNVDDQQLPRNASQSQAEGAFVRDTSRPEPSDPQTHDASPPLSSFSRISPISSFCSSVLDAILSSSSSATLSAHEGEYHTSMDLDDQQLPRSASQSQAEGAFVRDTSRPEPSDPQTHDASPPLSSFSRISPISSFCSSVLDAILSSSSSATLSAHEGEYHTSMDLDDQQLPRSASQSQAESAFVTSDTSRPEPSDSTVYSVLSPLSSLSRKSPVSSLCSSVLDAMLSSPSLSGQEEVNPTSKDSMDQQSQSASQKSSGTSKLKEPPLRVHDIAPYVKALGLEEEMSEDYSLEDSEVDCYTRVERSQFTSERRAARSSVRKVPSFKVEDVQAYLKKHGLQENGEQGSSEETEVPSSMKIPQFLCPYCPGGAFVRRMPSHKSSHPSSHDKSPASSVLSRKSPVSSLSSSVLGAMLSSSPSEKVDSGSESVVSILTPENRALLNLMEESLSSTSSDTSDKE